MTDTIKLPKEVINSNWKDDIDYEPYKQEAKYISPEEISKESIKRIKARKLNMIRGNKFLSIFNENNKLAA